MYTYGHTDLHILDVLYEGNGSRIRAAGNAPVGLLSIPAAPTARPAGTD